MSGRGQPTPRTRNWNRSRSRSRSRCREGPSPGGSELDAQGQPVEIQADPGDRGDRRVVVGQARPRIDELGRRRAGPLRSPAASADRRRPGATGARRRSRPRRGRRGPPGSLPGRAAEDTAGGAAARGPRRRPGGARSCRARGGSRATGDASRGVASPARPAAPGCRGPIQPGRAPGRHPRAAPRSTKHTPSANSPVALRAASMASRVFPTPPTPVRLTRRCPREERAMSASSASRPTKLVSGAGRLCRSSGGRCAGTSWRRIAPSSALQLLAGLDPELLVQRRPGPVVRGERVGLAVRAIQRQHQVLPQPLADRVGSWTRRLELVDELRQTRRAGGRRRSALERVEATLLEPLGVDPERGTGHQLAERPPAPERECLGQALRGLPCHRAGQWVSEGQGTRPSGRA